MKITLEPIAAIRVDPDGDLSTYERCEFCHETACEDIWAGKCSPAEWRNFFRLMPDDLVVCEKCAGKAEGADDIPSEMVTEAIKYAESLRTVLAWTAVTG